VPRHRLMPHVKERASVCRLSTALIVWPLNRSALAVMRQWVIRVTRTPAFGVAAIMPLVFAGAVGAAAPRFPTPTTALPSAAITPVAVVTAAGSGPAGPAVVAVERPPISLHIAAATVTAPPPTTVVNSPGALGIPAMALSAYRNAEQMMAGADPGCGISWNLLAGIGRIESMHANGGATDARGTLIRPIYGPALDGTLPGNEVIVQSGAVGRISYARAMGPMQFLPGTWARYASDGDGDGVADPQNLYDSTLAAARYLCTGGLDLRDQSQVLSAILRYNNSMPYARNVLGWAAAYATGVVPVDLPPVTGPAPPLGDMHLENPEGIGPGLPLNIHGLPSTDPLAQMPLIDLSGTATTSQQPMWPSQSTVLGTPSCTVICIGQPDTLPPQQLPWLSSPPPDAPPSASPKAVPPGPSTSPSSPAGQGASPAADTPVAPGPMPGMAR
jgi:membrane-bound lytic murein transglycosylase B